MQAATTQNFVRPQQQQQQQQSVPHQHNQQKQQQGESSSNLQVQTIQQQPQPSSMHQQQSPHQHMEGNQELSRMCFVCCLSVTEQNYESVKTSMNHSHAPLLVLLTDVLGYKLDDSRLHSEVVCKSCYHLLDIIDELQQTLAESKTDVRTKFLETVSKMRLKYPRTDKMLKPRCLRCIQMSQTQTRRRGRGGRGFRGRGADEGNSPKGRGNRGRGRGKGGGGANPQEIQQINTDNDSVGSQSGDNGVTWKVVNPDEPAKLTTNTFQQEYDITNESKLTKHSVENLDEFSLNNDNFQDKCTSVDGDYLSKGCKCVKEDPCDSSNNKSFAASGYKRSLVCPEGQPDLCSSPNITIDQYDAVRGCYSCGSNGEDLLCLECPNCFFCRAVIVRWGFNVSLDFVGSVGAIKKVVVSDDLNSNIFTFVSDNNVEGLKKGKEREFVFELEKYTSKKKLNSKNSNTSVSKSVGHSSQIDLKDEYFENELIEKKISQTFRNSKSKYKGSLNKTTEIETKGVFTGNKYKQNPMIIDHTKNKINSSLIERNETFKQTTVSVGKNKVDNTTNEKDMTKSVLVKSKFVCEICGKDFNSRGGFTYHVSGHHKGNIDIYSCDFCPHTTRKLSDLRKHLSIHTGEKSFMCDICNRSFSFNSSYRRHMRIHNEEKTHSCNVCKKLFRTVDNLKAHKVHHTGERKYKCEICGKLFRLKHHYKTHLNLHTGKIKRKCKFCNTNFSLISELKDHCQKFHSNEEKEEIIQNVGSDSPVVFKKLDMLEQAMAAVTNDSMDTFTLTQNDIETRVIDNKVINASNISNTFSEELMNIDDKNLSEKAKDTDKGTLSTLSGEGDGGKGYASGESSQMYFVLSDTQTDNQQLYLILKNDQQ